MSKETGTHCAVSERRRSRGREPDGGVIGIDPASAYPTISARCLNKCVASVFLDNLLLRLDVDNFHKRVTRGADLDAFSRLLALELWGPSAPNVSESQVLCIHLSGQAGDQCMTSVPPPMGKELVALVSRQASRAPQSLVADQGRRRPRPCTVGTRFRQQLSQAQFAGLPQFAGLTSRRKVREAGNLENGIESSIPYVILLQVPSTHRKSAWEQPSWKLRSAQLERHKKQGEFATGNTMKNQTQVNSFRSLIDTFLSAHGECLLNQLRSARQAKL